MLTALRSRQDQPFPLAMDTVMSHVYGAHPYGRPLLGRPAALDTIDRTALLAHHQRFYRAPRMILAVSGDVAAREVVAEITRLFADAPAGEGEPEPSAPTAVARADRTVIVKPSAQAQVLVALPRPAHVAPRLRGGEGARHRAGRRHGRAALHRGARQAGAGLLDRRRLSLARSAPGVLYMQLGTAPANQARAEAAMLGELERIRREPLNPAELARAKAYLLGQFALDRRTNARLAWYDAFFEALGVGPDFAERYTRAVEAVSAEDVHRVARTYLAAPTVVTLGPAAQ